MIRVLTKKFDSLINKICFIHEHIKYGSGLKINGRVFVRGNIKFGDNVRINSGFRYNPIGGQERAIFFAKGNGKIRIGNNVGISNSAIVSQESIVIEDDVLIGGSCKIYDSDFHSIILNNRVMSSDPDVKTKPIHIKKGAFVGAHSIVLKGVTIGEGAIVGAGSVVTKDIPDGEIWAGNPAKFINKL